MEHLYAIVSSIPSIRNKKAKGKKGSIVAVIEGTKAYSIIDTLNWILNKVKKITLDIQEYQYVEFPFPAN